MQGNYYKVKSKILTLVISEFRFYFFISFILLNCIFYNLFVIILHKEGSYYRVLKSDLPTFN